MVKDIEIAGAADHGSVLPEVDGSGVRESDLPLAG
jgi:hypothetical protein